MYYFCGDTSLIGCQFYLPPPTPPTPYILHLLHGAAVTHFIRSSVASIYSKSYAVFPLSRSQSDSTTSTS